MGRTRGLWNHTNFLSLLVIFGALAINLPLTKSSTPVFLTKPSNVTVKSGQNAVFKCEASGFPVPTIRWYKNGIIVKKLMLRHYIGLLFKTLYIMPVYALDAGQITCEAFNKYGTIRSTSYLRVVTKTKPTWKVKPQNVTLYEGQVFEIQCQANGFPSPTYTWTKGYFPADFDSSIVITPEGEMRFAWASDFQSGKYKCSARNAAGSISKTIMIKVVKDPTIIKNPIDAMGVVGQELSLQCDIVGNPMTKIKWKKDGKELDIPADPRMSSSMKLKEKTIRVNTLIIKHAKNSDSGKYQCVASNLGGTTFSKIAVVNLTGYSKAPTVILPSQYISAALNSDIKLTCQFTGTPLPQIKWLKYIGNAAIMLKKTTGDPLGIDKVETTLEIHQVSKTDEGNYICMAQNGGGIASGNITLKVQEDPRKPKSDPGEPHFKAVLGTNATLKCTFNSNPKPEIKWYRNGTELTDSWGEMVPGSNNTYSSTLMLANVDFADDGPYKCQALNPYGKAQMTVFLNIGRIPMPPTDLTYNRTSRTNLFISWQPGKHNEADVRYLIEYKHSKDGSWTGVDTGSNTNKMLRNADGWNGTWIRVRARNSYGTSKPSEKLIIPAWDDNIETVQSKPRTPEKSIGNKVIVATAAGIAVLLLLLVLLVGVVLWRKRKRKSMLSRQPRSTPSVIYAPSRNHEEDVLLDNQGQTYSYVPVSSEGGLQDPRQPMAEENEYETVGKPSSWEVPKRSLTISNDLGKGHFGKVVKAILKTKTGSKPVAVKMLKENAESHHKKDFMAELDLMKSIGPHPNIVGLVGCCTKGENPYIIVEYCSSGNLRDFLRKSKGNCEYSNLAGGSISLTSRELLSFMWQVARGMSFLASKKLVHRDLAARNVLVHEGNVCKIADFGLARDIYQENQYLKTTEGELPLRWMALESIFHGVTTIESDVWSFGVLLWEIITLGANPYPGFTREQLISNLHLGYRMPRPPYCNEELYGVIWQCWQKEPSERPTFPILCRTLNRMMAAEKVLIDLVNFDAEYINAKKDGEPVSP